MNADTLDKYQEMITKTMLLNFELALEFGIENNIRTSSNTIRENYGAILKSNYFPNISPESLEALLKIEGVGDDYGGECYVFKRVQDYLREHTKLDPRAIVRLIRFPTMTVPEFAKCMNEGKRILSAREQASVLMDIVKGVANDVQIPRTIRSNERIFTDEECMGLKNCVTLAKDYKIVFEEIPTMKTKIRVNRRVVITTVVLFEANVMLKEVTVDLTDKNGRILASGSNILKGNLHRICVPVNLNILVELKSNIDYFIEINYKPTNNILLLPHVQNVEKYDVSFTKSKKSLIFSFEHLNPMINFLIYQSV